MSLKTDNFKLYKYEDNDIGDLRFINDSMDIIDKGINPFYVATESSTNVYKVTTGLNKTALNDGYSIKVAIPSNSTGAVSITVDSVTVPVKKPNGNAVTNFKQNGVYSLTYYNSVFILASGGVDDVNFSASDLLTGKTANDSNGEKVNGTMPNKGAVTASLNCGGSYTIPKGYHNGSGKVTANSLSSQTSANATAKDIIKGKTAWVNGSKLTGTATITSLGGLIGATGTIQKSRDSKKGYHYFDFSNLVSYDLTTVLIYKGNIDNDLPDYTYNYISSDDAWKLVFYNRGYIVPSSSTDYSIGNYINGQSSNAYADTKITRKLIPAVNASDSLGYSDLDTRTFSYIILK